MILLDILVGHGISPKMSLNVVKESLQKVVSTIETMEGEIERLKSENERYRKAMEEIKSESEFGDKADIQRVFEISE